MNRPFPLPPKMALKYQEMAKRGEATRILGKDILDDPSSWTYIFSTPTEEITLVGLDPPCGHYKKLKITN